MANKTQKTDASVEDFLNAVEDEQKRKDAFEVLRLMAEVSGKEAKMWGPSIVGFGTYHYKYASGREGNFMRIGFSPRKTALTLYIMAGFSRYDTLMKQLGKYKTGKACLYIKRLEDVDQTVLLELMKASLQFMEEKYGKEDA
tara:strand:+ start:365 stop:790 length:426 start_codon:yes stop_codon:yes gene_type:complete